MKLIITTQHCENYAAHNGFNGEYHWKFKGGDTYVVDNLTDAQKVAFELGHLLGLKELIESDSDYFREYIISTAIVPDDAVECEEWDTPFRLSQVDGEWYASRKTLNEEFGYMRREIEAKFESYLMAPGGELKDYTTSWRLRNGQYASSDSELRQKLAEMEDIYGD